MSKQQLHNEDVLVGLLKSKDKKGMEMLYDNYSQSLFGVIFKIVKTEEVAEDILQKTFIKIWEKIDFYDDRKGRLFTWMLNIARNNAIDFTRSKEYKKSTKVFSMDYTVYNRSDKRSEIRIDEIGLDKIVEQLEPKYKKLIDLVYFEGYTQQEVSEELEIPLGTVKTRIRKAIMKLRSAFK